MRIYIEFKIIPIGNSIKFFSNKVRAYKASAEPNLPHVQPIDFAGFVGRSMSLVDNRPRVSASLPRTDGVLQQYRFTAYSRPSGLHTAQTLDGFVLQRSGEIIFCTAAHSPLSLRVHTGARQDRRAQFALDFIRIALRAASFSVWHAQQAALLSSRRETDITFFSLFSSKRRITIAAYRFYRIHTRTHEANVSSSVIHAYVSARCNRRLCFYTRRGLNTRRVCGP